MVGDMLTALMEEEEGYQAAMRRFLTVEPTPLRKAGTKYPTREEIYDPAGLR